MRNAPPRAELFGFYYLGFAPDGSYKFPSVHHVARFYNVTADDVREWLDEHRIDPATVSKRTVELSRHSVDIQMELANLSPEGVRRRVEEALAEFDRAGTGRKPWIDGPIT